MSTALGVHVLILAGGLGTRLRSVVADRPKVRAMVGLVGDLTGMISATERT